MRFLCVSDQIDPLVYSSTVKERYGDVDAVFCAGDLSMEYVDFITDALGKPVFFVFGNHDLKEYKYYKNRGMLDNFSGSSWGKDALESAHGADYAGGKMIRCRNLHLADPSGQESPLLVCGVSGSRRYNNGSAQFTEHQMKRQLAALTPALLWNKARYGRYCDVFLTHASPRHIHDKEDPCHQGFECFNDFIRKFRPALLVHGHIHLYDLSSPRCTMSGGTAVVNAFSRVVLDFELETVESTKKGETIGANVHILANR